MSRNWIHFVAVVFCLMVVSVTSPAQSGVTASRPTQKEFSWNGIKFGMTKSQVKAQVRTKNFTWGSIPLAPTSNKGLTQADGMLGSPQEMMDIANSRWQQATDIMKQAKDLYEKEKADPAKSEDEKAAYGAALMKGAHAQADAIYSEAKQMSEKANQFLEGQIMRRTIFDSALKGNDSDGLPLFPFKDLTTVVAFKYDNNGKLNYIRIYNPIPDDDHSYACGATACESTIRKTLTDLIERFGTQLDEYDSGKGYVRKVHVWRTPKVQVELSYFPPAPHYGFIQAQQFELEFAARTSMSGID